MSAINELIILIPVILNLKGNLEMNLSARLGTAANVGELDEPSSRNPIIWGNLSLLQVQAALVSFVAANVSFVLAHFMPQTHVEQVDPFPEFPDPNVDVSTNTTTVATRMLRLALSPRVPPTAYRPHPIGPIVPKFSFAECVDPLRLGLRN
jgi:solute carrier family 41